MTEVSAEAIEAELRMLVRHAAAAAGDDRAAAEALAQVGGAVSVLHNLGLLGDDELAEWLERARQAAGGDGRWPSPVGG